METELDELRREVERLRGILPEHVDIDPDNVEHDWHTIFSSMGVLQYDTTIAGIVRFLGWCGMLGVVGWLVWQSLKSSSTADALTGEFNILDRRGR